MKKMFKYASLGAIALVGAVSFSACSSSDEIVDNPNYNPADNTVKTQFTISLPQNVVKGTRQSAATVQNGQDNNSFRGFDNMVLIPYASVSNVGDVTGDRLTATSITLNPRTGSANTLPSNGLNLSSNSYVYSDVSIPLGTSGFLFYGKAVDAGTDKFVDGYLTAAPAGLTGENTGFSFALNPTKPSDNDGKAGALLAYINSIAAAAPTETTAKAWYTSVENGGNAGLLGLYNNFVTLKAGSSTSVQAALEDLYESLKNNTDPASQAVCTAILGSGEKIMAEYDGNKAENQRLTLKTAVAGYPTDINLPDGAVGLTWSNATPAVASWLNDNSAWSTGSTTVTALDKYVYPASLYYRANSPVTVSNSKQSDNYGSSTWAQIVDATNGLYKNGSSVGSSTQSVALVEQIQYAVALLESHVKIAATTLKDRKGDDIKIGTETSNDGTFKLTGILIGGQKNVDWQFLPTTATGASIYTIYDKDIPDNVLSSTESDATNYTLALENGTDPVYVALEFENNAKDFIGKDGLVAKGTKFYLVAQLNPTDKTGEGHTATGELTKVFMQDYKTIARFKIKENSTPSGSDPTVFPDGLGAAYNVIPDLRTPKMELGLSVDLTWQPGLQFDINL